MIIFNWIGAGMAVLAMLVLVVTDSLLLACFVLMLLDIPYRLWKRDKRDSVLAGLLAPHSGGQFFFVPCWAWAIILVVGNKWLGGSEASTPPTPGA